MTHENKFGMFIHWGLYSLTALHEQALARYNLDRQEYESLMHEFNPTEYNPEEWVLLAKRAGMKYICFTAKHHDGFCMWDTKYTDFNVMNTPYGRDVLRMLADACYKHGMLLSIYYSNPDWHHPSAYNPNSTHQWSALNTETESFDEYKTYIKNQITELLTNYGKIYTLFWDIPPKLYDPSINELARSLQPDIYINDRGFSEGDFSTPERECNISQTARFTRMTEACNSVGFFSWGYRQGEIFYSKNELCSAILSIMARGGSYLLNVGPTALGTIDCEYEKRILAIGDWYIRTKEALESHADDSFDYGIDNCIVTKKNGKTYLNFPLGLSCDAVIFKSFPKLPERVRLLNLDISLDTRIENVPKVNENIWTTCDTLEIINVPVDKLAGEPIVIEIEW